MTHQGIKLNPELCRELARKCAASSMLFEGELRDIAAQLTAAAELAARHEQVIADRDVEAKVSSDRLHQLVTRNPGGLTHAECEVAARNWGIDLTCGECASVFYTGHSSAPHDAGCKTQERPALAEERVREVVRVAAVAIARMAPLEAVDPMHRARILAEMCDAIAARAAKDLAGTAVALGPEKSAIIDQALEY